MYLVYPFDFPEDGILCATIEDAAELMLSWYESECYESFLCSLQSEDNFTAEDAIKELNNYYVKKDLKNWIAYKEVKTYT